MKLYYYRNKEGIICPPKTSLILNQCNRRIKGHIIVDSIENKHCIRCDTFKSTWDFGWDKSTWDGLDQYCKACRKEMNHARNDRS